VDQLQSWYDRRTSRVDDYTVDDLVARRRAAGTTVSVVLPSRNEADTITGVVSACGSLVPALVDEIVVVDGGSDDATVTLARTAGARVLQDRDLHPEAGPVLGKGDALWRSLEGTAGDILVFVDTDIRNPDPRFVIGLLGPLLLDPGVQFVKAFYERPVQLDEVLHPTGGGRVTELMARPLLNLFWPALAGLVQPLAGEYAGRRTLLERLPFFTGYGVELGLLVDTLALEGADAIAQVDVHERIHRNQSIDALSRMAFGILQVAMARVGVEAAAAATGGPVDHYVQFERVGGQVAPRVHEVPIVERPPLRTA
jgi:glucosyl-3-phosphoglycerate synthase